MNSKCLLRIVCVLLVASPVLANDTDGDGITDLADNCIEFANPDQRDTDNDLFGNRCDPDLDNSGKVDFGDLMLIRDNFFATGDLDADFDGDGSVNFADLQILKAFFFGVPGTSGPAAMAIDLQLTPVFPSLQFESQPLAMHQAPGDLTHWYVIERNGRIVRFDAAEPESSFEVVLDISDRVDTTFEGGLLGFAFPTGFDDSGQIFVSYTTSGDNPFSNPLDSRLSRFTLLNTGLFDPASELVVMEVDQPYANHNGGDLHFGPDNFLYWSLGDGGSGGDPLNSGQDTTTLLGALLRIDVDVTAEQISQGTLYTIPTDNPFQSSSSCATGCPEVYAWGLRNLWRFSFDRHNGDLYGGDVGQSAFEEIDLIVAGGNYGWRCYEGNSPGNVSGCAGPGSYAAPLVTYSHSLGNSVTGGYVYRGSDFPGLRGVYLYGDFGSGRIWGLVAGKPLGELINTGFNWVSFAEGHDGELYAIDYGGKKIYRIGVGL